MFVVCGGAGCQQVVQLLLLQLHFLLDSVIVRKENMFFYSDNTVHKSKKSHGGVSPLGELYVVDGVGKRDTLGLREQQY